MIKEILILFFALLLPGFFTVTALFNMRGERLSTFEVLFLSLGLSLCVLLNLSFVLNYSAAMRPLPFYILLLMYTTAMAVFSLVKKEKTFLFLMNQLKQEKGTLAVFFVTASIIFFSTYNADFNLEDALDRLALNGDAHFFVYIARQIILTGHYVPGDNALNYAPGLFLLLDAVHYLTRFHLLYICSLIGVFSPLLTFLGVFVLAHRFLKSFPVSLLAGFLFMSQIMSYKSFAGPTLDPFVFSFILFLFLINKPFLSGIVLSTSVFTHQYPLYAIPVIALCLLVPVMLDRKNLLPSFIILMKVILPVFVMIFALKWLSPEVLSPRPIGNALDFRDGVPVRTFYRAMAGYDKTSVMIFLSTILHVLGLAGCFLFFYRLKSKKANEGVHEGMLCSSGLLLLLFFALAQPVLYTLGIKNPVYPFNAMVKSFYNIQLDAVSDPSFLGMFKRAFFWMEPGRPILFFSIFAVIFTSYLLNQSGFLRHGNGQKKAGTIFSFCSLIVCFSLLVCTGANLLNLRKDLSARVTYTNYDKTFFSSSDIKAMIWIYKNMPEKTRLGITNLNGKIDPHLRVSNQNRMVTAFTLKDVPMYRPQIVKEGGVIKAILSINNFDAFLFQSIEFQTWGLHFDIREGAERLPLKEWMAKNNGRIKLFQAGNYKTLLVFSKKTSSRKGSL